MCCSARKEKLEVPEMRFMQATTIDNDYLAHATGGSFSADSILKVEVVPHERFDERLFSNN